MRHVHKVVAPLALGVLSSIAATAEAGDLPLRRILLTTGGVGYFEHEAIVTGDARLKLDVRLDQVSDVLKSITVFDEHGRLGGATLAGRAPLSEVFRDLPFTLDDLASPASLLRALRGSVVRLSVHATVIEGRIITVTDEETSLGEGKGTIVRHRITLMGSSGMRQALIEDADSIEIVDPNLRSQVEQALMAIAEHGATEQRTISINADGDGERLLRIGYVVAAPLWKATYRLVLPNQSNTAEIEGFAVLENMSGHDWVHVDLSLASGNPVTFKQALYESYFVNRPEVPVEVFGRFLPPVDVGTVASARAMGMSSFLRRAPIAEERDGSEEETLAPPPIPEATEGATSVVFHLPEPIDLARGNAMLTPILSRHLPVQRVSVFARNVNKTNPTASLFLRNDSDTGLPPGAMAIYEEHADGEAVEFVGDAQLGALPVGQDRLIGYAADLEVRVDFDDQFAQNVTGATIDRGVLVVRRVERRSTKYRIAGAADEARTVIIEHPRIQGFALVQPTAGVMGETPENHRIRIEVPAGQTVDSTAVLERPIEQRYVIGSLVQPELGVLMTSTDVPARVREALVHVADLQRTVADREASVKALETERKQIESDQDRLRKNLEAAPAGSDLRTRYLQMLGATEDRIVMLDQQLTIARESVTDAKEELAKFIASLSL